MSWRDDYDDDEPSYLGDDSYEECSVCHQEYRGVCHINSSSCPYRDEFEDDLDDEDPDFEDVEDLKDLDLKDDEVDQLLEETDEIPPEDLLDEEDSLSEDDDDDEKQP